MPYVSTCITCSCACVPASLRAFVVFVPSFLYMPNMPYVHSFLGALHAFLFFTYLFAFTFYVSVRLYFFMCLTCLHFLGALRTFTFLILITLEFLREVFSEGVGQFDPSFIFQEELIEHQYSFIQLLNNLFEVC